QPRIRIAVEWDKYRPCFLHLVRAIATRRAAGGQRYCAERATSQLAPLLLDAVSDRSARTHRLNFSGAVAERFQYGLGVMSESRDVAHHCLDAFEVGRRQERRDHTRARAYRAPPAPGLELRMIQDVVDAVQASVGNARAIESLHHVLRSELAERFLDQPRQV